MKRTRVQRSLGIAGALVAVGLILPAVVGDNSVALMALFLPFALLALSVDILWGENRLVTFGHGAFFALGGYVGGLVLVGRPYDPAGGAASLLEEDAGPTTFERTLGTLHDLTVAGVPIAALILPMLICGVVGLVVGGFVFRAASPEVYLPIITLGLGVVAGICFNELEFVGASNGLAGVPEFTSELAPASTVAPYYFNLAFAVLAFGGYAIFRATARGWTWRALGDDPVRLEALGYPVARMRAQGFGVSCAVAGLAGALYAATANFMSPTLASVTFSAQALIWCAVGGVGTVLGPLVGTLVVKWGEEWLSSSLGLQESWPLLLGLLLILVVLVAPGGLMGGRAELLRRVWRGKPSEASQPRPRPVPLPTPHPPDHKETQ
jgi:urea transport system permease protein